MVITTPDPWQDWNCRVHILDDRSLSQETIDAAQSRNMCQIKITFPATLDQVRVLSPAKFSFQHLKHTIPTTINTFSDKKNSSSDKACCCYNTELQNSLEKSIGKLPNDPECKRKVVFGNNRCKCFKVHLLSSISPHLLNIENTMYAWIYTAWYLECAWINMLMCSCFYTRNFSL